MDYNFKENEKKWLEYYNLNKVFKFKKDLLERPILLFSDNNLDELIYLDILSRYYKALSNNVLVGISKNISDNILLNYDIDKNIDLTNEQFQDFYLNFINILKTSSNYNEEEKMIIFNNLEDKFLKDEGLILNLQTNINKEIKIPFKNYHLIYGVNCLVIPTSMDEYILDSEKEFYNDFLNSEDEFFYTGVEAIHPLNKSKLPIFILKNIKKPKFLIPCFNKDDLNISNKIGLNFINVIDNDLLINSNELNYLTFKEAKNKIQEIYDFEKYEDYYLNKINLNNDISKSILPFSYVLKNKYDYYKIDSLDASKILNYYNYKNIYITKSNLIYYENSLISKDLNELKILKNDNFITEIFKVQDNNLNLEYLINTYGNDATRLHLLTNYDINYCNMIINRLFKLSFYDINFKYDFLEESLSTFYIKVKKLYFEYNFKEIIRYFILLLDEIDEHKKISYDQLLLILQLLSPIIPFVTEEMYRIIFNSKDCLIDLNWPEL